MRAFLIKAINLILVCSVLYGYQGYAAERARDIEEYEQKADAAKKAWREADSTQSSPSYADGTYEGTGTGFGGEIQVQVEIQGGEIRSAKVLTAEKETPDYLKSAKKVLENVVKEQSADVDTVTGATLSSNGILEGIRNALEDSNEKAKEQ